MRKTLQPAGVAVPKFAYSQVVVAGDFVYTSGQVGRDIDEKYADDFEGQLRLTFENLRACLEAAGCTFDDVVRLQGYLTSMRDFPAYDRIYREYLSEPFPARTTLFTIFEDHTLVELDAVAYLGDDKG